MGLTSKLVRGSTVNLVEHAVKLLTMFVTTPMMVRHLGEQQYGTWLVTLVIIGYLRLLDLGISFSGTRFLAQAIGSKDDGRFATLYEALTFLYQRIGLVVLILSVVVSMVVPIWLPNDSVLSTVKWLVLGLGITTGVRFWTRIFEVVLKSHVRYDLIGVASILKTVLQGGAVIYFLTQGFGLLALLFIFIVTDLFDQFVLLVFARRVYPKGAFRLIWKSNSEMKPLLSYSATAVITSFGKQLRNGVDPLIIGHVSGLAMVPVYSIGGRFLSVFTDVINAFFGGNFLAAFSQLDGRDDRDRLVNKFLGAVRISSSLAVLGGAGLAIFGPSFIERWVGPSFDQSSHVLLLLTGPTVLMLMQYPIWAFFYSQNQQHRLAVLSIAGGAFNVVLSVILASQIGFLGVVWATVCEMLIVFGMVVPYLAARLCGISLLTYLKPLLRAVVFLGGSALLYYFAIQGLLGPDYLLLVLFGTGWCLIAGVVTWLALLTGEERLQLLNLLHRRSI